MKNHFLFSLAFLFPFLVFSQKKFKTNSVSIFKDGTVFLDKTTLDASSGKVTLEKLPFASPSTGTQHILFGTFWMVAENNSIPFAKISRKTLKEMKGMNNLGSMFQKRDMNVRNSDDLITIEGSIDITNYRNKSVQMEISRKITGELGESDLSWQTTGLTTQLNSMNPKFKVKWEFELKAKETKKIIYTYKVYVR